MTRFAIRFRTTFRYDEPVVESHDVVRACPATDADQRLVTYHLSSTPSARVTSHVDYFGTRVDKFGIRQAHDVLEVVADAVVETAPRAPMAASVHRDGLTDEAFVSEHHEYLQPSPHVTWDEGLVADLVPVRAAADGDLVGRVLALHRAVHTQMRYQPGETFVGVALHEVWDKRAGVCQDYAHLLIAACRAEGIPARYVSGYLYARDEQDGEDPHADELVVATHAWVEVALPGVGWWALDPTNGREVGERHVTIGRGRDYDDVAPIRGTYVGAAGHEVEASVHMRRLA